MAHPKKTEKVFYPSWRYHPTAPAVIVAYEVADAALMAEDAAWRDTPYPVVAEVPAAVVAAPSAMDVTDDVTVETPDAEFATPVELVAAVAKRGPGRPKRVQ